MAPSQHKDFIDLREVKNVGFRLPPGGLDFVLLPGWTVSAQMALEVALLYRGACAF